MSMHWPLPIPHHLVLFEHMGKYFSDVCIIYICIRDCLNVIGAMECPLARLCIGVYLFAHPPESFKWIKMSYYNSMLFYTCIKE
jgi:hypothetical protein